MSSSSEAEITILDESEENDETLEKETTSPTNEPIISNLPSENSFSENKTGSNIYNNNRHHSSTITGKQAKLLVTILFIISNCKHSIIHHSISNQTNALFFMANNVVFQEIIIENLSLKLFKILYTLRRWTPSI